MTRWLLCLTLALAACDDDTSSGVPGAVSWLENLQGTDASSLRVALGQDAVVVAALNLGVVHDLCGLGTGDLGSATQRTLIVARFLDLQSDGLDCVWAKSFDVVAAFVEGVPAFSDGSRISLAVAPNGDPIVAVTGLNGTINFGAGAVDGHVGNLLGAVAARLAFADGAEVWSVPLTLDADLVSPAEIVIDQHANLVIGTGSAQLVLDANRDPLDVPGPERLWVGALDLDDGATSLNRTFGSGGTSRGARIARTALEGALFVSGTFTGTLALGDTLSSPVATSHFVTKLAGESGEPDWATAAFEVHGGDLLLTPLPNGNAVVAGDYLIADPENPDPTPASSVGRVSVLSSSNGALVPLALLGDGTVDQKVIPTGVATDSEGNVILAGSFRGRISWASRFLTAETADALFVVKLDGNGEAVWGRFSGGTDDVLGSDLRVGAGDAIFATGVFEEASGTVGARREVFILKLDP
jgi:hypothetical protein